MKLLHLSPTRFPTERAHGAQIAHMCNAFAQNGAEVTLFAPKRKDQVAEDPFAYYGIPRSFTLKQIFCTPWGVSTKLGFFSNLLVYTLRVCFFVVTSKPDVVYSRDEFVLFAASFVFPTEKIVWESHEAKYNFAARSLLKRGTKCVAISEGIKEFYTSNGASEEQVFVAHDGIDESFFGELESKDIARKRLGISTDKPVAMYIGGLDPWKGVKTFFEASKYNDDVQYVVIGGRADEVEKYAAKYPKIQFLGRRPYNELKDNQQAADVLVVPNTKKNELSATFTSPLKLFAHLASGVPLIVSDIPSMRNVVSEEQVTFFQPDDPGDLAEKISLVLEDAQTASNKAKNAHELSKKYTWSTRSQRIIDFVGSVRNRS